MTNSTPAPWHVGRIDRHTQTVEIDALHGHQGDGLNYNQWTAFVECMGANEQPVEGIAVAEANARHIVHCVNNHERLVKALRRMVAITDRLEPYLTTPEEARALLAELDAGE